MEKLREFVDSLTEEERKKLLAKINGQLELSRKEAM